MLGVRRRLDRLGHGWSNGRVNKREEMARLRERVAALEGRLEEQAVQLQSLRDLHLRHHGMMVETWGRTVEVLHVTWEALRAMPRSGPPTPTPADEDADPPHNP